MDPLLKAVFFQAEKNLATPDRQCLQLYMQTYWVESVLVTIFIVDSIPKTMAKIIYSRLSSDHTSQGQASRSKNETPPHPVLSLIHFSTTSHLIPSGKNRLTIRLAKCLNAIPPNLHRDSSLAWNRQQMPLHQQRVATTPSPASSSQPDLQWVMG